jgi:hypothetical protein
VDRGFGAEFGEAARTGQRFARLFAIVAAALLLLLLSLLVALGTLGVFLLCDDQKTKAKCGRQSQSH